MDGQVRISQPLKESAQARKMLVPAVSHHNHVIEVGSSSLEVPRDIVDHPLKSRRGIIQVKKALLYTDRVRME